MHVSYFKQKKIDPNKIFISLKNITYISIIYYLTYLGFIIYLFSYITPLS